MPRALWKGSISFEAAALEKTRTVDIIDFVKADEIDDRFFETPYWARAVKAAAGSAKGTHKRRAKSAA